MINWLLKRFSENRAFLIFIFLMSVFRSAVADWNTVPSGSMKPTILEGDRIFINKMAYDIRVPFTNVSLLKISDPIKGDIIIFDSEESEKRLVKRVIGVPGDTVELRNNVLIINGKPLEYESIKSTMSTVDHLETLLGYTHSIRISKYITDLSSFKPVDVPENHYLVLGDNRDNSADSRMIGFIPRNEIVGRTKSVVLSLNYENFYIPRKERFFHRL